MDRILKFKLWGDYAHFKKYYTTTSPLTFEFPPPPTVIGIISAIIGLDKNEYLKYFQNPNEYKVAIKLDSPVIKVRWTVNLIDTKHHFWRIKNRTQIRTEFLKNPLYTVYFWHNDNEIYQSLKHHLKNHSSVYSISLGLSELLANFEYLGEESYTSRRIENDEFIQIDSVVPSNYLPDKGVDYEVGKEIFQVNFPIFMNPERVIEKRAEIIFERNANPIKCKPSSFCQLENGEKIVFF